jgi:presenilin-like A22 family membrane protease
MKFFLESIESKNLLKVTTNAAGGAVIGTLVGFLLYLQHFIDSQPVEGSRYLNGKGEIAIYALVGAVLLPATLEALRWAAKRYLAGLLATLKARSRSA